MQTLCAIPRKRSHFAAALLLFLPLVPAHAEELRLRQGVMEYRWETSGEIGPEGERTLDLPLKKKKHG